MQATRWPDWYGELSRAVDELSARCRSVFVFGLSMGGTLTLRLAEEYGDAIAGICLVNPSVTTLRRDAAIARYLVRVWPWATGGGERRRQARRRPSWRTTGCRSRRSCR